MHNSIIDQHREQAMSFKSSFLKPLPAIIILAGFLSQATSAWAATYYAAPNGSGTSCTIESPCAVNAALGKLTPGCTLYLRGGRYTGSTLSFAANGILEARITISGYPGETAIIDGQNIYPVGSCWAYLVSISGDYVTIRDLQINNSNGAGLFLGGNYTHAKNVSLDVVGESGIVASGKGNIIDGCTVSKNGQRYPTTCSSWGSAICAAGSTDAVIQNCISHNNVGEGLNSYAGATGTIIQNNISYENNGPNLYMDRTKNTIARGNILYYLTNPPPNSNFLIGSEGGDPSANSNNNFYNNFLLGGKKNIYSPTYVKGDGLVNWIIAYNTLVNSTEMTTGNLCISSMVHSGTIIKNNIILQENSGPICYITTASGLTFSYNNWSKSPCANASGTGDVIGDPKLAKIGPYGVGTLTAEYFKILSSSAARDVGSAMSEITADFFGNNRLSGTYPDMGGHEYGDAINPNILNSPTGLRIVN